MDHNVTSVRCSSWLRRLRLARPQPGAGPDTRVAAYLHRASAPAAISPPILAPSKIDRRAPEDRVRRCAIDPICHRKCAHLRVLTHFIDFLDWRGPWRKAKHDRSSRFQNSCAQQTNLVAAIRTTANAVDFDQVHAPTGIQLCDRIVVGLCPRLCRINAVIVGVPWARSDVSAASEAWYFDPAMGRSASTAFLGIPLKTMIPNFKPSEWRKSARGLKPAPPAEDGKRLSAGVYLPLASMLKSEDFEFPSGVGFVTNHSMSTTTYCHPYGFRFAASHLALDFTCSS